MPFWGPMWRRARSATTGILAVALVCLTLATSVAPAGAASTSRARTPIRIAPRPTTTTTPPPPEPPKAWILVDADRGVVLNAYNAHEPLPVASAAKLMTALLAVHRLGADAPIPVDFLAASRPPSRIGMKAGERWTRQEALEAALIVSANDAAYALGTAAAGSLEAYGAAAAAEGRSLGLRDSTWVDPAGLDGGDGIGAGNHVSAFDLAILARAVLADPLLSTIVDQQLAEFVGPDGTKHTLHQHNKLLDSYPGAIGVKTGYTSNAGEVLVAAARRDGRTLIAVTIGGSDAYGPSTFLLDAGFASPPTPTATGERLPILAGAPRGPDASSAPKTISSSSIGSWDSASTRVAGGLAVAFGAVVAALLMRRRRGQRARTSSADALSS
ncbi:MAG TPA: hypothetical protein VGH94_01435 [Acidimicrobiales bacterium]